MESELKRCPICGAKAFLSHDIIDGFDFGFSVGCPRFRIGDGIHGIDTFEEAEKHGLTWCGFFSEEAAAEWWNKRADDA